MVDNLETIAWTYESGLKSMQRKEAKKGKNKKREKKDENSVQGMIQDAIRVSFEL